MRSSILLLALAGFAWAQTPPRPRITGIAHMALYVKDIEQARAFYKGYLGFDEPFWLDAPGGGLSLTFIKINDRQYIELFPEKEAGSDRLNHISIETDDAEAMRLYLKSRGIAVPEKVGRGRTGNANFNIKDPEGHTVEIVQYLPTSWTTREHGKFQPQGRISVRMKHIGIIVTDFDAVMKFYREVLGFTETWRGGRDPKVLSWVNLKVPDGDDYVELMLYAQKPPPNQRGTAHHICLEVDDIEKAKSVLSARSGYSRPLEIRTGINRKRQLNLYDADGTRTELMEPNTVDGQPTPPSTGAPPR